MEYSGDRTVKKPVVKTKASGSTSLRRRLFGRHGSSNCTQHCNYPALGRFVIEGFVCLWQFAATSGNSVRNKERVYGHFCSPSIRRSGDDGAASPWLTIRLGVVGAYIVVALNPDGLNLGLGNQQHLRKAVGIC